MEVSSVLINGSLLAAICRRLLQTGVDGPTRAGLVPRSFYSKNSGLSI